MSANQYKIAMNRNILRTVKPLLNTSTQELVCRSVRSIYMDRPKCYAAHSNGSMAYSTVHEQMRTEPGGSAINRLKSAANKRNQTVPHNVSGGFRVNKLVGVKKTLINQMQGLTRSLTKPPSHKHLPTIDSVGKAPASYKIYGRTTPFGSNSSIATRTHHHHRPASHIGPGSNKPKRELSTSARNRAQYTELTGNARHGAQRERNFVREVSDSIRNELMPVDAATKELLSVMRARGEDVKPQHRDPFAGWKHPHLERIPSIGTKVTNSPMDPTDSARLRIKENTLTTPHNEMDGYGVHYKSIRMGQRLNEMYISSSKENDIRFDHRFKPRSFNALQPESTLVAMAKQAATEKQPLRPPQPKKSQSPVEEHHQSERLDDQQGWQQGDGAKSKRTTVTVRLDDIYYKDKYEKPAEVSTSAAQRIVKDNYVAGDYQRPKEMRESLHKQSLFATILPRFPQKKKKVMKDAEEAASKVSMPREAKAEFSDDDKEAAEMPTETKTSKTTHAQKTGPSGTMTAAAAAAVNTKRKHEQNSLKAPGFKFGSLNDREDVDPNAATAEQLKRSAHDVRASEDPKQFLSNLVRKVTKGVGTKPQKPKSKPTSKSPPKPSSSGGGSGPGSDSMSKRSIHQDKSVAAPASDKLSYELKVSASQRIVSGRSATQTTDSRTSRAHHLRRYHQMHN